MIMTEDQVRAWLLRYAWMGTSGEQAREVECIIAQDGWKYLDARIERTKGQAWDEEQATEAEGFELSALYECHDEPHLATCPRGKS